MAKNDEIKRLNAEKEKTVLVLYVSDSEGKYGAIQRKFFECTLNYSVWSAEPFEDDYLVTMLARPRMQEIEGAVGIYTVKVYRVHFHSEVSRGYSMFEVDNRNADGLTVKRTSDKEITKVEFEEKLKTHKFKILQEDGANLVPLKMYVRE
ncbi:MAG: hypothetical protein ABSE15_00950 [Candidatus Bathyarchaeia archaeon]|jgi:hypothetical protein